MQQHMEQADTTSASRQTIIDSSPGVCTSPSCSVGSCRECPSPDEFHCFDLRSFVQPLPVITSPMLQTLADDTDSDKECVSTAITEAGQLPRNARQTSILLIDCKKPQSKPSVAEKFHESMSVCSTPLIILKTQSMSFDQLCESPVCIDGTVTSPLSKKRKIHRRAVWRGWSSRVYCSTTTKSYYDYYEYSNGSTDWCC